MINALIRGFRELATPAIQRLLLRCVLLTLATLVALIGVVAAVLFNLDLTGLSWLDPILATAGSALVLVVAWFLFPIVAALTLGLFADDVAAAVERYRYPDLPEASGMSLAAQTYAGVRFVAFALLLNLVALPLYLLPGANLLIYLVLNGYLLGREYFEQVVGRRLPLAEVTRLRRQQRGRLWFAGVAIAAMLMIPFFNLVAPVVAIAFMVHLVAPLERGGSGHAAPPMSPVGERPGNSTRGRRKHLTQPDRIATPTEGEFRFLLGDT
jgi:CysZ protein